VAGDGLSAGGHRPKASVLGEAGATAGVCESTKLHEELQALGIVRLALQRLGQPTAIQRLLPSMSLCAPSLEISSVQTSRRLPCRVLAGVTAGAAVSTYGVWMLPRPMSQ
jgi:hypothetical protein